MPEAPLRQKPQTGYPARAAGTGRGWTRRLGMWSFGVILTCALLVSLAGLAVAMMPVSLLIRNHNIPAIKTVYGSLWTGRADLQGDYQLNWNSKLRWGHLETPITLSGDDTRVTGVAYLGVTGLTLEQVTGRAGPGLAMLIPGAWQCDMTARVSDVALSWGWFSAGAAGQVMTPKGTCEKGNRSIDIAPLSLDLTSEGSDAVATLLAGDAPPMAVTHIRRDRVVDIRIEPRAADVFPALPRGGPITLQVPF